MRKQLSIVLVEGDHVPRELSGLLVGMGVWVKSTWSGGLAAALEQTTPHLVVCGDPSQLPGLQRTIAQTHPGTPLLLIGDWNLERASRAVAGGLVEDLIPDSLPAVDIARRLESLAARRAQRMPSRATLTPPTRAGIHPLLAVDAGRDERTPESRQDHPAPSRRPPPPPVRVVAHVPVSTITHQRSSLPPAPEQAYALPPIPRPSSLPREAAPAQRSAPPPGPFRSTVPGHPGPLAQLSANLPSAGFPATRATLPGSAPPPALTRTAPPPHPSLQPAPTPLSYRPPASQSYPPQARSTPPQRLASQSYPPQARSTPPQRLAPQSYPPRAQSYPPQAQSYPPQSYQAHAAQSQSPHSYPYALSPDSAPPIQMITRTTTTTRTRRRRSGPGFTLGAALGVAASAAAFVGIIEFERDLRTLTSQSVQLAASLVGSEAKLPAWLGALADRTAPARPAPTPASAPVAATTPAPSAPGSQSVPASGSPKGATAPLELSDLGAIETEPGLGMSLAEASALFRMEDRQLPGCEQLLASWKPPLPLIEEDRPKHGAIHRRQAQEHLVAGEPEKALQELCKSARIDPAGLGTETLAGVYLAQRSLEQAETWIRRYLAEHPRSDSARELLGDIACQRGRVAEAKATWLDVLGVDADATGLQREVAKHWVQDAATAFGARDLSRAERKLRRALTLDPTNAGAAVLLARVLEKQGDQAASVLWAKRAREL